MATIGFHGIGKISSRLVANQYGASHNINVSERDAQGAHRCPAQYSGDCRAGNSAANVIVEPADAFGLGTPTMTNGLPMEGELNDTLSRHPDWAYFAALKAELKSFKARWGLPEHIE